MIKSARVARFVLFWVTKNLTCLIDVDSMRRLLSSFVVRTPLVVTRWFQREKKSSTTDCTHFRRHGHRLCLGGTENGSLEMSLGEIDWIDGNRWNVICLICINFLVDSQRLINESPWLIKCFHFVMEVFGLSPPTTHRYLTFAITCVWMTSLSF